MSDIETEKMSGGGKKDGVRHSDHRRKLLKGVAASAPIIMTLANRPAWGAVCWSGIQSGNMSRTPDNCRGGKSPGYYKKSYGAGKDPGWPAPYNPGYPSDYTCLPIPSGYLKRNGKQKNRRFYGESPVGCFNNSVQQVQEVFPSTIGSRLYDEYTLMQALWQFPPGDFIFHAIAVYFNSLHYNTPGNQYIFNTSQVLEIVNDIFVDSVHTDPAGNTYDASQMICIFDATYDDPGWSGAPGC